MINEEIDLSTLNIETTVSPGVNVDSSISSGPNVVSTGVGGPRGEKGEQGIQGEKGEKGGPGTTNYANLTDKPQINDVTLHGNKSFEDLGAETLSNIEIDNIINSIV